MSVNCNISGVSIEKLKGRENYSTWAFAVKNLLQLEELWEYANGEISPEDFDIRLDTKAKSKIILLIEPINFVHVQDAESAEAVWNKLRITFEDSGLTRRVNLLRTLITTRLEKCENIEEYVNQIVTTAHKLNGIGLKISEEWIGTLLLAGLPEEYSPMIMGIESSGVSITGDSIKTKLLQEIRKIPNSKENAFYTRKDKKFQRNFHSPSTSKQDYVNKGPRCFTCNKYGHIAKNCKKNKNYDNAKSTSYLASVYSASTQDMYLEDWFIDSGASKHMTMREDWLANKRETDIKEIIVANHSKLIVKAIGDVNIDVCCDGQIINVTIHDVLYLPELTANLLSVSQLTKTNCRVIFNANNCEIFRLKEKIGHAVEVNNMYKLVRPVNFGLIASTDFNTWHQRMAHLNFNDLSKLKTMASGINFPDKNVEKCLPCLKGKQTRQSFGESETRASSLLELVHSDLCGPMETASIGGSKYFISFIDDFSRKTFVYFLDTKTNIKTIFESFKAKVENQTGLKIKYLRTDNGTEFCNRVFDSFLDKCGIIHQTTVPYTPQQNGLAERMNRTIVEKAKCMMFNACLDKCFWAEAVATAIYLINRSPCKGNVNKTPEEIWSGTAPNLNHLRIF